MSRTSLYVFAHQDDEVAAAPQIVEDVANGVDVLCAFLTDGGAGKASPAVRDAESAAVLSSLGVHRDHILFLGSRFAIPDGALVEHIDRAYELLEHELAHAEVVSIHCLAWEGGHQDHDASHLIALAVARKRSLLEQCFELPLYRGSGSLFRTLAPLPPRAGWEERRLSLQEGVRFSLLVWRYRTQWRSWTGLFPELALKLAILRRSTRRAVALDRVRARPHSGALLYERRFRFPYERFVAASARFIERHL
jgi:LmbE family N-acetylglucosaminyl deacetylase